MCLLSWENEAWLVVNGFGRGRFDIVYPPRSIRAEPPVAVVEKYAKENGTQAAAEAYLRFLYTAPAQEIAARHFSARNWKRSRAATRAIFRRCNCSPSGRFSAVGRRRKKFILTREAFLTKSPAAAVKAAPPSNPLPGFSLTLGFTIFYLTIMVLAPIAALALKALRLPPAQLWEMATNERALEAYKLSLGASLVAALINAFFGSLLAWVLVRYPFPGRRLLDGLIDFPFALPTAVAGLTLANLFSDHGWLGQFLAPAGHSRRLYPPGRRHRADFRRPAFFRAHPPAGPRNAGSGSGRGGRCAWERAVSGTVSQRDRARRCCPTMLTGFGLSFARALGEYGSIVFISGNLPQTEIAPTLIVMRLNEYDYTGAIAVALVLMIFSFALLLTLNMLQGWAAQFQEP